MAKRKTHEEFVNEVFNQVKNDYKVLGQYVGTTTKIKIKHVKCNHEYEVRPYSFLQGKRCPNCFGCIKKTHATFIEEVYSLVGDEYVVLGQYLNTATPIKIKHAECGTEYKVKPNNFLDNNRRCPKCFGNSVKNTKIYKEEVFALVGDEYSVLGEYKKASLPCLIKHHFCGTAYKVTPNNFLRGQRCPECINTSRGELKISKWLDDNNFVFVTQYKIDDCKSVRLLRFDFAIFQENKLSSLIEFDGRQHFEAVDLFGGEEQFALTQKRDRIKNKYCSDTNIPLLRIPHWEEKNIEFILDNFIKNTIIA